MTNGEYINKISDWLVILCRSIEKRKRRQRYDITHDAEDVFAQLLNMVYGWNLENANRRKPGFPAGDLIDDKNRLFVQVTSNKDAGTKVEDTINGFVKKRIDGSRFCEEYDRLIILLASYGEDKKDKELKQQYQKAARNMLENDSDVAQLCTDRFDPETDIWDCDTIVGELEDFNKYSAKEFEEILSSLKDQILPLETRSFSSETADYPENAYHLRRLADNLWINWKTGCLAENPETALSGSETEGAGKPFVTLSPGELRLLSVLVQGEGAVVSWEELYERGVLMQEEMEDLLRGNSDNAVERALRYGRNKEASAKKASEAAIKELCEENPVLAGIIKPSANGKGYWIELSGNGSRSSYINLSSKEQRNNDWKRLEQGQRSDSIYSDIGSWLRRFLDRTSGSFEKNISNADAEKESTVKNRRRKSGAEVFGDYTMLEAYSPAYAVLGETVEPMLDCIEKWYRKAGADCCEDDETYGKVLVLHGQPGDGKTTFCKKAVYAHLYEGWLIDAPEVLRISLNPHESEPILSEGDAGKKLDIGKALCLRKSAGSQWYFCDPKDLKEGTLLILDGYDELAGNLAGVKAGMRDASTFFGFCKAAEDFARENSVNVIITSRTMCIEEELDNGFQISGREPISFAPMDEGRQEMMIDRMIELDAGQNPSGGKMHRRKSDDGTEALINLEDYRRNVLPKLRKEEALNELLQIPILFRMIVACRFEDAKQVKSAAGLYSSLFHSLMTTHKAKEDEEVKTLLGEYEQIAARIFIYQKDTCPFSGKQDDKALTYLFFTSGSSGSLGFLHGSFRQFFLARYILGRIQTAGLGEEDVGKDAFWRLMRGLRAGRISGDYKLVFELMEQLAAMKETDAGTFLLPLVTAQEIKNCLSWLDDEEAFLQCMTGDVFLQDMTGKNVYPVSDKTEKRKSVGAENAVFNILSSFAALERGLRKRDSDDTERIQYREYGAVCGYLRRGDYSGINLSSLDFSGTNLGRAYLKGVHLSRAILSGTDLTDANLVDADLSKANLTGAVFRAANLSGSSLEEAVVMDGAEKIISFRRENLKGATLKEAVLGNADFSRADLSMSNLSGAKLVGANLFKADISKAYLDGAHLERANLAMADLSESRLIETLLFAAHVEKACLKGATLWKANLTEAHLEEARLDGAVLAEADLRNAHLERASLKQAYLCAYPGMGTFKWKWNGKVCGADPKCDADLKGANLAGADFAGAFLSEGGYKQVKTYEKAGGRCVFGLPGKAPDGRIKLAEERYQAFIRWSGGKSIINPMKEKLVPYGIYQGETLMWRVLRRERGRVLLITEKVIAVRVYHPEWKEITWEDCYLRRWLNEDFISRAFTDEERSGIACVTNQNPDNMRYRTAGGRPTEDRVFALSIDEAEAYFGTDEDRTAVLTDHAFRELKARGKLEYARRTERGVLGWWWLRSHGFIGINAACVGPDGGVDDSGLHVGTDRVGVRPALWLNQ